MAVLFINFPDLNKSGDKEKRGPNDVEYTENHDVLFQHVLMKQIITSPDENKIWKIISIPKNNKMGWL